MHLKFLFNALVPTDRLSSLRARHKSQRPPGLATSSGALSAVVQASAGSASRNALVASRASRI
jgi:hypothetical protein